MRVTVSRLAIVLLALLVLQPLLGAITLGQELIVLEYTPTSIYNLYEAYIKNEGYNIMGSAVYMGKGLIALAGNEYITLLDAEEETTIWSESLIGNAISMGADSSEPKWVAVGTDSGEIVAFKMGDPRERIDYYTAQAADVIQTFIAKSGNNYRLMATIDITGERYLYIYEPGKPYWAELGPVSGDEPASNISGLNIAWVAPLKVYTSYTSYYYDAARTLIVLSSADRFTGTVRALIYYNNTDTLTVEPALPGSSQLGDLIEVRNLTYYLLYRGGVVDQGEVGGGQDTLGYQLEIPGLYQTITYKLLILYEIKLIDNTSNVVVDSQCYYNVVQFTLNNKILDLGQIILNIGGRDKNQCLEKAGVTLNNIINTNSVMILNTLYGPNNIDNSKAYTFKILPTPEFIGFIQETPIYDLIQPYTIPKGMDEDARIIFAVSNADTSYVYIYVLDENFNIINFHQNRDYVEKISVKDEVSTIKISPDAKRIYIGTSDGRIIMLKWNEIEKRYIAVNSMKISYSPISSIIEISPRQVVVTAEDGSMQLIDTDNWIPLWRGAPGYSALKIDAENLRVLYGDDKVIYAISKNKLIKFNYNSVEYQPIILDLSVTVKRISGDIVNYEGNITIYAVDDKNNIVLKVNAKRGEKVTLYLPTMPIDLYIELEKIGKIKLPDVRSKFPNEYIDVNISLKEISILIYTPNKVGDERRDPGYMLVAGPQPNASIVLTSQETRINNYIVLEGSIEGISDENGIYKTIIFNNVKYNVIVSKEQYTERRYTIQEDSPANISIDIHPILYRLNMKLLDKDAQSNNVIYKLNGTANIIKVDSMRQITVEVKGDSIYYLPKGKYNITVSVPHYRESSYIVSITGSTTLEALLDPENYSVVIIPHAYDRILGISDLILNNSIIYIKLISPYEGSVITTRVGEQLTLRYGLYEIEVRDSVTQYVNEVLVNRPGNIMVLGELKYSTVELNVFDEEVENYTINNISLTLIYMYNNYQVKQISISLKSMPSTITIPYGSYLMVVSRMGYESQLLNLSITTNRQAINIYMKPAIMNIEMILLYRDTVTGIARGSVPSTSAKLVLIDPDVNITYSLYGDENGRITGLIREGIYEIVVDSPYTKTAMYTLKIDRITGNSYTIYMEPKYAVLNITVVDNEIPVKLAGVSIAINRLGPGDASSFIITSVTGREQVLLPLGDYVITAEIPSRYLPTSVSLRLMNDQAVLIRAEPVRVSVLVSALAEDAYIQYRGVKYPLPPGIIDNATIRIIPSDPLLVSLGVEPIEVNTGPNGTTLVQGLRAGTYMIVAIKEGYISKLSTAPILTETRQVAAALVPVTWSWVLDIKDMEVIEEYSNIEQGKVRIITYNNIPAGITIEYRSGDTILMPTGVYNVSAIVPGYLGIDVNINVIGDGSATLPVKSHRAILTVKLTANVAGAEEPVVFGQIEALAVDVPLKDPIKIFNVTNGIAHIEVRPGTYKLAYTIGNANARWDLGQYNITSNYTINKIIDVELIPVNIKLIDGEYDVEVDEGKVEIKYIGPFGERTENIEQYRPGVRDTVLLPPGIIEVNAQSYGYDMLIKRFFVGDTATEIKIYMNPIKVPIIISFANPDNNEINEPMLVIIKHTKLPVEYEGTIEKSTVYFENVRVGEYELIVKPVIENSIYNETVTKIEVLIDEVNPPNIIVNYKLFNVSIMMIDKELNTPIEVTYKLSIDRKGESSQNLGFPLEVEVTGKTSLLLPPGEYTATLAPVEFDVYTPPPQIIFKIPQLTTVKIDMDPKRYPVSVLVLDDRGKPLDGALVSIQTPEGTVVAAGYTDTTGQYSAQLRFGTYNINVERVGYIKSTVSIQVPIETAKTVSLEPELVTKIRRMAPLIIGLGGLLALMITLYVMRERLTRRILEEEEYF